MAGCQGLMGMIKITALFLVFGKNVSYSLDRQGNSAEINLKTMIDQSLNGLALSIKCVYCILLSLTLE